MEWVHRRLGDAGDQDMQFASRSIFCIVLFAGSMVVLAASISVIPQLIYQTSD